MDYTPITLGTSRVSGGAQRPSGVSKKLTSEQEQKIFERDDYACRCCGFKSMKYQTVCTILSSKGEARHFTACIFCYQCFNMDEASNMRSGVLVWLPEITQNDLHHIARAVYVSRISQGPVAEAARQVLDVLMRRREEARQRLGTDDPSILSMVLSDYVSKKAYAVRARKLEGIRLFPLDRRIIKEADLEFNQFPQILAYWRSKNGPFGGRDPKKWIDLYRDMMLSKAA